jgi:hypothetical protein
MKRQTPNTVVLACIVALVLGPVGVAHGAIIECGRSCRPDNTCQIGSGSCVRTATTCDNQGPCSGGGECDFQEDPHCILYQW